MRGLVVILELEGLVNGRSKCDFHVKSAECFFVSFLSE